MAVDETITSPAARPARAAGNPAMTPATPACVLNGLPGTLDSTSSTPRKPLAPTWTVAEEWPASIWPAMEAARLTGIAKPWVAPDWDWNWNVAEAAVSRPITRPGGADQRPA